jgi:hypothetical protein
MKITQLTTENFKRIKAVRITPDGSMIPITGRNAQGKSSVLDSIAAVLGGKDMSPAKPVRTGAKKSRIVCQLDDLTVTRTFTEEGGGTLTVTNADGARYPSPQAVLDKIVGKLTLDPLAFSRMPSRQQLETLKGLVGLDFTELDEDRAAAYSERTIVNRSVSALRTQADAAPSHPDAPAMEVSVAELAEELYRRQMVNEENASLHTRVGQLKGEIESHRQSQEEVANAEKRADEQLQSDLASLAEDHKSQLERLNTAYEKNKSNIATRHENSRKAARVHWASHGESKRVADLKLSELKAKAEKAVDLDTAEVKIRMGNAEALNRKVRENAKRAELERRAAEVEAKSQALTERIDTIDAEKNEKLAAAAFPVDGLSFDDSGVIYKGVPFAQASSAEQLRASVAIGLAMNPKLRVLLVRDGSLLDAEGLAALGEIAEANDAQVWIERVADGEACGIVIEDGCVVDPATVTDAVGRPAPAMEASHV